MTIMIEVVTGSYGLMTHRFTYKDPEVAAEAYRAMSAKVGHKFANDPEMRSHTLTADDGLATFVMAEVVAVRLFDNAVFRENTARLRAWHHQDVQNESAARARGKSGYALEEDEA